MNFRKCGAKLIDHEIDVLVCTTIIETGVDVPNANTLIIDNADRLGLSQLHQIRGRVGRSSRRAYAYLTFTPSKVLTEIAQKRLSAIREFTEFGSGFKIAMRDLEIRGAGNILGGEQHGHMESVGYDLYLKLLGEAVQREKGEEVQNADEECVVDMQINAHIPEKYISSLNQRLEIYRRIADIRTFEDSADVVDELIDRFGDPPQAVKGLIDVALLRNLAGSLGITEVKQLNDHLLLYKSKIDMAQMARLTRRHEGKSPSVCRKPPLYQHQNSFCSGAIGSFGRNFETDAGTKFGESMRKAQIRSGHPGFFAL